MGHAAGLEDVEQAVALAVEFDVADEEPGIHDGRDADVGAFLVAGGGGEGGEDGGDLFGFEIVDEAGEHGVDFAFAAGGAEEVGDGVEDAGGGLEVGDVLVDHGEVHFEAVGGGAGAEEFDEAFLFVLCEVEADGGGVAEDLGFRFFEGEVEAAFAALRGFLSEVAGDGGFAGARGAGDEDGGGAVVAFSAEHGIEARDAGGDEGGGCDVVEGEGGDGEDGDAVCVDEERVFVGAVDGAAIFDDAEAAGGDLVGDAVVEEDDAVGDVFFEALAGEGSVAAFGGDDGGEIFFFEPVEEAAEFGAEDGGIGEAGEEGFDSVEHDAFGADGFDGVVEADEEAFEIVFAVLFDFGAFVLDVVDVDFFMRR